MKEEEREGEGRREREREMYVRGMRFVVMVTRFCQRC